MLMTWLPLGAPEGGGCRGINIYGTPAFRRLTIPTPQNIPDPPGNAPVLLEVEDAMLELTDSQWNALTDMLENPRRLVIGEVGAGKTVVASEALHRLTIPEPAPVSPLEAVVVTPSYGGAGPAHWIEELERASSGRIEVVPMIGDKYKRADARFQWAAHIAAKAPAVLLCTYSGLTTDVAELIRLKPTTLIIDEAHRLAGRTTKQAKAAITLGIRTKRVWFLTGTPVLNEAQDLWPLFRIIDKKTYRGFWDWAHTHLDIDVRHFEGQRFDTKIIKGLRPGEEVEIRRQLESMSVTFKREDAGEPPRVNVLPVELSPAERRLYDQLEQNYYAEHDDQEVVAANDVAKLTRLRQISSDWSGVVDTDELGSKAKVVIDFVKKGELRTEKVVILAAYKSTVEALLKGIGAEAVDYHGDLTDEERNRSLDDFIHNVQPRILVGTLAALGEGINGLQHACHNMILLDREWNHPRNDQVVGRLFRHGQEHPVNVWHVVAAGSTDQKVAEALKAKAEITEALGL